MKKRNKIRFNKKAVGNDVDWIIAMGIFLIYLVMTLVYFKPGVKPVFNPQNLLDIVDENFGKTAYWEVTTQPMFVTKLDCKNPTPPGTPSCPLYNNNEIFEFLGNYRQAPDNKFISPDTPSNEPLKALKKSNINTQIFFVKPKVTSSDPTDVINSAARTNEGAIAPAGTNIDQAYVNGLLQSYRDNKNCQKCNCEIRNLDRERCKEHEQDKNPATAAPTTCDSGNPTDQKIISDCKTLLEQIAQAKASLQDSSNNPKDQPSQTNPVAPNELVQNDFREGYIKFNVTNGNLRIKPYFSSIVGEKTKYLITTSNIKINNQEGLYSSPSTSDKSGITYKGACLIPNYNDKLTIGPSSTCFAKYELGVAEILKGIYLPGIASYADLPCEDNKRGYDCIKLFWGYPENKEFKIRVYTPDQKAIAEFPKEPIIPTNVNIYSRQFNSFILNDDGLKKPVTVSILVW